jgi:hypothetical protein
MEVVYGGGVWRWCMEVVYGGGVWRWCLEVVSGGGVWRWCHFILILFQVNNFIPSQPSALVHLFFSVWN